MEIELKLNGHYAEEIILSSGESVRFRLLRTNDKAHVRRGFAGLSPLSRRKRFLTGKGSLSIAELRYFTELDQFNHFAIGAMSLNAVGVESEAVGVARFVRFSDDPRCAEVAIAVVDRLQGKGIGSCLLQRLGAAANERGVESFRFDCLPDNLELQRLVRKSFHSVMMSNEDGVLVAQAKLADGLFGIDGSCQDEVA